MLKLGSDQRRKWLYLCGSHRIYWHLWEFSSVSNQILTLRWIQTKNSKNISWSFPSWHRPPVRLSSSGHFTFFFFLHISLVSFGDRNTFNRASQKKQNKHLQFLHQICPKNKKKNQTFTLSARIWTQRCDSDFAQGCKISLESLGGVHVSLTVWPSPTQRPVDALIINCIAKNNPTTRLSSSGEGGGGLSWETCIHRVRASPPPPPITHYCCFAQCAKTKRGANHDGRTEEELQQKHRTQSDASGGFQKSTFVHFHLCRWRAERDDTIVWARGPIRWLLFL